MTRFFVEPEELASDQVRLTGENLQHARVLRLKQEEKLLLCDGQGREALCAVREMGVVHLRCLALLLLALSENRVENVVVLDLHLTDQTTVDALNKRAIIRRLHTGSPNYGEEQTVEKYEDTENPEQIQPIELDGLLVVVFIHFHFL